MASLAKATRSTCGKVVQADSASSSSATQRAPPTLNAPLASCRRANSIPNNAAGCSIEAHDFAEIIGRFDVLGATGAVAERDEIGILTRFSMQASNGGYAVASDECLAIARSFDALMQDRPDYAAWV